MNINQSINDLSNAIDNLQKFTNNNKNENFKIPFEKSSSKNIDFAIGEFLRKGDDSMLCTKSLSSANGSGSLLMPNDACVHIFSKMTSISTFRTFAKSVKISTDSLEVLYDNKSPSAGWSTETKYPISEDNAEFKKIKIPTHEIFANIKITQKLLDDSNIDVYEWFVNNVSRKISELENNAFWFGDGDGKPKGIFAHDMHEKAPEFGKLQCFKTGKNGDFVDREGDNFLMAVATSLKREYSKNAVWLASRSAYTKIQQLKDEFSRNHIFKYPVGNIPATLYGYPIFIDDALPELSSEKGTCSIVFGDFSSAYMIVDRSDINLFRDPYSSKPFVEFFATKRTGGDVVNFDAIRVVKFSQ